MNLQYFLYSQAIRNSTAFDTETKFYDLSFVSQLCRQPKSAYQTTWFMTTPIEYKISLLLLLCWPYLENYPFCSFDEAFMQRITHRTTHCTTRSGVSDTIFGSRSRWSWRVVNPYDLFDLICCSPPFGAMTIVFSREEFFSTIFKNILLVNLLISNSSFPTLLI